ncbi:MAG TPA: tRNA 2-thiouridine(34) synthase MnmA, partial [Desulfatiglandales bacterium]|nr:tRNA 2-thiouridine(34) synthase MnmA [Desulfatiglandales bacterium]
MIKRKNTVAVALSGGIDSSCAAAILIDSGWEVVGIHLIIPTNQKECEIKIKKARLVSEALNIPLYFLDARHFFQKKVIDYFISSYFSGLTPNPCVVCNQVVKFEQIIQWMSAKGIDFFATGHYARVKKNSTGRYIDLLRGIDERKDQSYFLHRLNQSHLSRTIFPLGCWTKEDIYILAKEKSLPESMYTEYTESQEICFIPDNDYRAFFKSQVDERLVSPGNIINSGGDIIGTHSGTYAYTIGQRHGLGISATEPLYVSRIMPEVNQIAVAPKEMLFTSTLMAEDFNWIVNRPRAKKLKLQAQIRYRHKPAEGTLTVISPD